MISDNLKPLDTNLTIDTWKKPQNQLWAKKVKDISPWIKIKKDENIKQANPIHNNFLPHYYNLNYYVITKKWSQNYNVARYFWKNKDKFPGINDFYDNKNDVGYCYCESDKDDAL